MFQLSSVALPTSKPLVSRNWNSALWATATSLFK